LVYLISLEVVEEGEREEVIFVKGNRVIG